MSMKPYLAIFLVAAALVLSPMGGEKVQCSTATIMVKISDHFPVGHIIPRSLTKPWMARVEELTGGRVKFTHYPSQQLVKQVDALPALQRKVVHIALVNPGLFPTEMPLSGVLFLPGAYDTVAHGGKALKAFFRFKPIQDEFAKVGVKPLLLDPLDPYEYIGNKPIHKPHDMKGVKLRVVGEAQISAGRVIGATPVSLAAPEMYTALQRRTLDGVLFGYSIAKSYRLNEVAKYGTLGANISYAMVSYCVNEAFWNGLEESIRKAMIQAADEIMPKAWVALDEQNTASIADFKATGFTVTVLGKQDQAEWQKLLNPVREQWVTNMKAKGLPGAEVLQEWDRAVLHSK